MAKTGDMMRKVCQNKFNISDGEYAEVLIIRLSYLIAFHPRGCKQCDERDTTG